MTAGDSAGDGVGVDGLAAGASSSAPPDQRTLYTPTLVIVSGRPGSGKTTLARELANALPCPLVSRDEISEGIYHTFNHDLAIASKATVTAMAFDAFFTAIQLLLSAQVSVVAEAAFQNTKWRQGLAAINADGIAAMKIIQCVIDPAFARQRVLDRRNGLETPSSRRAAQTRIRELGRIDQDFTPVSLPASTLIVKTIDGYEPSIEQVLAFIRERPGDGPPGGLCLP